MIGRMTRGVHIATNPIYDVLITDGHRVETDEASDTVRIYDSRGTLRAESARRLRAAIHHHDHPGNANWPAVWLLTR